HQLCFGDRLDAFGDPAALAADPPVAHVEHLHRGLQLVGGHREHIGVRAVGGTTAFFSTTFVRAARSSRNRAARSKSSSVEACFISRSRRRTYGPVCPAMKSQNSSAIARWSSTEIRSTHGAAHLSM